MVYFISSIKNKHSLTLILIGILSELAYLSFTIFQGNERSVLLYITIYFINSILLIAAYQLIKKIRDDKHKTLAFTKKFSISSNQLIVIFFALLFRLTLLPASISTSDDTYRYIWEGKLVMNGHNPFELAPDDEKLNYLHSETLPEKVTFKNMTTIYPPFAQSIFALGYFIGGDSDWGLKIIYLFAELLIFLFLIKLFRFKKINNNNLILYAWLPLPVMEFFINSHIDIIALASFIIFIYYIEKDDYKKAILPFCLSVLTKLIPLIIAPLLIKKIGFKKSLIFGGVSLVIIIVSFFPFIPEERSINASLFTYLSNWSFNGSIFKVLYSLLNDGELVRKITLSLFIFSIGFVSLKYKDFAKAALGIFILFISLAATVYPWYLGWFALLNPLAGFYSVFSLLITSNFSNFTPLAEVWKEYTWVSLFQYVPFYVLLIYDFKNKLINNKASVKPKFYLSSNRNE